MFMGVPYMPFFAGAGSCLLLALYFNMFFLLLAPPLIFAMRQMARRDEMIFRLLALHLQFRLRAHNRRRHAGMWMFTPNHYRGNTRKANP